MSYRPNIALPGADTTAARLTDTRFPYINLAAPPYNAPLDGQPHTMTQAAALAMYPQCAATGTIAQDTAAWKQAESDIRTSSVRTCGVIGLPPFAQMVVSEPLHSLNATKVLFHGSELPGINLLTASCSGPALHATGGGVGTIYYGFEILAQATAQGVSTSLGGAAWTGYTAGKSAMLIENCQGSTIDLVGWNGFDDPIQWGDNTYGIDFFRCGGSANNIGWGGRSSVGLNSFERIRFLKGSLNNNNTNADWDLSIGNTGSQGGSIFIVDTAMDYPVVRQIRYVGTNKSNTDSVCSNSMHVVMNHMETTGACSGTTPRIYSKGSFFMSHNEVMENDTTVPIGYIEVADNTLASASDNRWNNNNMAIFWSSTAGPKLISERGNNGQYQVVRMPKMIDGNGKSYVSLDTDGKSQVIFGDPNPLSAAAYYGAPTLLVDYFGGAGFFTVDNASFETGYTFTVVNMNNPVTVRGINGASLSLWPAATSSTPAWDGVIRPGQRAVFRRSSQTQWDVIGEVSVLRTS